WAPIVNSEELKDVADRQTREYAAELRWQDKNIGAFLTALESKGLMDDTLLAVTADHGQGLEDGMRLHRWGNHRMLYREQVHVPLIFKGPGVPAGQRVLDQVRTADLAPTLLELAGLPPIDDALDGESLTSRINGEASGDLWAYGEQINGYDFNSGLRRFRPDATFLFMVSDGEWKLVYKPSEPQMNELFHVAIDPLEKKNVIADNRDQEVRLLDELALRNPWVTEPFPRTEMTDDEANSGAGEAMKALGYSAADKGSGQWSWVCPQHRNHIVAERGRHAEGGCNRILVPIVSWVDPPPKEGK
ncbi:MAG: sulfatase-like hydrolase/transferase, partial [Planctomycetota bacterium]